ncbi:MAG: methylamine utilization protein [Myxococcota bacterium]|nr:methylamine utilization protein [Myxococcota bacterium]
MRRDFPSSGAPLGRTSARVPRRVWVRLLGTLCLAGALAHGSPSGAETRDAESVGTGELRGSVRILKKRLFGGVRPARTHGDVLLSVRGFGAAPPEALAELRQRNKRFEPRVLPVVVGQRVRFPNDDDIYHNVFSVSPHARFDLGHYKGSDPPGEVAFDAPGIVPIYCNIHPEMLAYVVVLENAAFTFSDGEGGFRLEGLPAGSLQLDAWIPGAEMVSLPIEIIEGAVTEVELEVEQVQKIPAHRRKDGSHYPPPDDDFYDEEG